MLLEDELAEAEIATVWVVPTAATFAVNDAVREPPAIVTPPGTVTAVLLLARATITPPLGAEPDRVTVHGFASDPVMEVLAQDNALMVDAPFVPVPVRATVAVPALLERVN